MKTEVRFVPAAAGQEVRMVAGADGKPAKIVGYAAVYNSLSQDLGGFREMVMPGAFARSLAQKPAADVRGRYNHEQLLGRSKSGTLRMLDDAVGLKYEIDVPDTSAGRDVAVSIARGDVDGSSFCFRVMGSDGEAWRKENGAAVRELRALELLDVGPVDMPAYLGTEGLVGVRGGVRALSPASREQLTKLLVPAGIVVGKPNLRHARLKFAEAGILPVAGEVGGGDARFYVESEEAEAALADACRQAANACDSVISLSWKVEGMDLVRVACVDCLTLCGAMAQVVCNPDSDVAEELAGVTGGALRACAKACKAFDHPICKLAMAVCLQAADQCDAMAGAD